MEPLIAAEGLGIGHAGRLLVSNLSLRVKGGEVLCLLGPNGAGKTTLFRSLLGLIPVIAGEVRLSGTPIRQLSRSEIATRLAHVPQALTCPFAFTARDIVLMGASARLGAFARPGRHEEARATAALASLGIADLAGQEVSRLSGGQRQLVLISSAIAQEAQAIIMDEPTASLDFANRRQVEAAIRGLAARGVAVVLSTHDPDQAAGLGDQALLLARGMLIASGPVDHVMQPEILSRLYGTAVQRVDKPGGGTHFY